MLHPQSSLHQRLAASGACFRARLTEDDIADVRRARAIFLSSSAVSWMLYYGRISEARPKFPATISWTIRRGTPRYVSLALWLAGWRLMLKVFWAAAGHATKVYALQMFSTGLLMQVAFPLGESKLKDGVHAVLAGLYMLDHHALFYYVNTPRPFRAVFYGSFGLMLAAMSERRRRFGLTDEGEVEGLMRRLGRRDRRTLLLLELAIMLFENALFLGFVTGMTAGLRRRASLPDRASFLQWLPGSPKSRWPVRPAQESADASPCEGS